MEYSQRAYKNTLSRTSAEKKFFSSARTRAILAVLNNAPPCMRIVNRDDVLARGNIELRLDREESIN